MVEKRNSDFQELSKRLSFEVTWPEDEQQEFNYPLPTLSAYESDALFWMVCALSIVQSLNLVWLMTPALAVREVGKDLGDKSMELS